MKRTRSYSDLDLDFIPHPLNGDISVKYNEDAVKRSLRNIILTNKYDRAFHPEIHSGLNELLFEPMTAINIILLKRDIKDLVERHEKRALVDYVEVVPMQGEDGYEIVISFRTINIIDPITTKLFLKRVR
jgi:phage baseplate assembly protein W